jgi:hypothetical protein
VAFVSSWSLAPVELVAEWSRSEGDQGHRVRAGVLKTSRAERQSASLPLGASRNAA